MKEELLKSWEEITGSFSADAGATSLTVVFLLIIGGVLALYLRFLYARCSSAGSDADGITRVFPLLTVVTTAVIAVVQASLALSLGLVGALSIVRFRAAIKEPEELVYLFVCIAVGLCLGANKPWLAIGLVLVITIFAITMHFTGGHSKRQRMLLTISGSSETYFGANENKVLNTVEKVVGPCTIHRLDIENGHGQVRLALPRQTGESVGRVVSALREQLPDCEFSYINMDSTV